MSSEDVCELRRDLRTRAFGSDQALYDPVEDRTLILNGAASVVVALCDGRHTLREIVAEIQARYPSSSDLRAEVVGVLEGLKAARLLTVK